MMLYIFLTKRRALRRGCNCAVGVYPVVQCLTGPGAFSHVFHAGGVLADATLGRQRPAAVRAAAAPKAASAAHVLAATSLQPVATHVRLTLLACAPALALRMHT